MHSCNPAKPTVLLLGRPNVGKSTLFNRFTRSKSALVDSTPGLTRDIKVKDVEIDGIRVRLADSGGIETSPHNTESLSKIVTEATFNAAEKATLIIVLFDIKEGLTSGDMEITELVRRLGKPTIFCANKADHPGLEQNLGDFYQIGADEILPISAEHGRGIDVLEDRISKKLLEIIGVAEDLLESFQPKSTEHQGVIKVALVGRPNVGKSSLFNRIVGEERVIVSHVPGTTRDVVDTLIERKNSRPVLLCDTAGIRRRSKTKAKIEKFSVLKAIGAIKRSHICLVVMDAHEGITDQDKRLISYTQEYKKCCITIFNKWDLVQGTDLAKTRRMELEMAKRFIPYSPHLNCSAKTGKKVMTILPTVHKVFSDYNATFNTGRLNRVLRDALLRRTPPISKGHHLKLYYTTQIDTMPPTFLIFANYPTKIPDHYTRFLINHFRNALEIPYTPIDIIYRQRERRG